MVNGITTEPVIVGIDPGTTSAVVVLGLDHTVKGHRSSKDFSKDQIIEFIVQHGKPLIIATDVASVPSLVADVASNMGAQTFVPDDDLQAQYKEGLTGQLPINPSDTHTMDAAAAAEYAYREHEDKLERILQRAQDAGLDRSAQYDAVELVMNGTLSTGNAINEVQKSTKEPDNTGTDDDRGPEKDWQRIAEKRQQQIDQLTDKVSHLEEYKDTLENRVETLEQAEDTAIDEQELRKRNREINRLRSDLDAAESTASRLEEQNQSLQTALERIYRDDWVYVPTVDDLEQTDGDIVYCDTYSGGAVSDTVDVVITADGSPAYTALQDKGVTVIEQHDIDRYIHTDAGYVVAPDELQQAISAADDASERFMEWLETYRKRQTTS